MTGDTPSRPRRQPRRTQRVATGEVVQHPAVAVAADCLVVIHAAASEKITERHVLDPDDGPHAAGRGSTCRIVIDSPAVSRQHASFERQGLLWRVRDLGSLNGTYVNDLRVHEHVLEHGDRIQVGDTIFKYLSGTDVDAAYAEAIRATMTTDGVTQALNDRAFRDSLQNAWARARRETATAALVILDVDRFKTVNDAHGHLAGDRVLRELVRRVRQMCPDDVAVARVGGEEFALVLRDGTLGKALNLAEACRAHLAATPFDIGMVQLGVTASFGVAQLGRVPETANEWFDRADRKMFEAKRGGRNRVQG